MSRNFDCWGLFFKFKIYAIRNKRGITMLRYIGNISAVDPVLILLKCPQTKRTEYTQEKKRVNMFA
jgi:hypothetical protein